MKLLGMVMACFVLQFISAQDVIRKEVEGKFKSGVTLSTGLFSPFKNAARSGKLDKQLSTYQELRLETKELQKLHISRPQALTLELPYLGQTISLDLVKHDLLTPDFVLKTSDGQNIPFDRGVFYRGTIKGMPGTLAAVAFYEHEVIGVMQHAQGSMVLGKQNRSLNADYILYSDENLKTDPDFSCATVDPEWNDLEIENFRRLVNAQALQLRMDKCVRMYLELDYTLVTEKGGVAAAATWITGVFNAVAAIYANESIKVNISEIYAWTTEDPYGGSSTTTSLNTFRSTRPSYNGDLAHLISRGAPANGGIAWVDALCSGYGYAYSWVSDSYSALPTYSWTVNVITHETGHNLGSPHTHSCAWPNGPIDGCGPTKSSGYAEGTCATGPLPAAGGGTIMSYCHLLTNVGINLANGFGAQPGNLIRSKVAAASCLTSCTSTPGITCSDGVKNGDETGVDCGGTCPPCQTPTYCTSYGGNTNYEYINAFQFGAFNHTSGNNNGYGNLTNLIIPATKGTTYAMTITPWRKGSTYKEFYHVWIDFNQDKDFADAGESFSLGSSTSSSISVNIAIPSSALSGKTVLRVQMNYESDPATGCATFSNGEVEDYTLDLGTSSPCAANQLPQVILTSDKTSYSTAETINLTASVTDNDGSITKVEFYRGGLLIHTDSQTPFTAGVTGSSVGNHSFTAKATDNCNGSGTSGAVTVVVATNNPCANNVPPVIQLSANKSSYNSGETIQLSASASDTDGSITRVEFYQNGALLHSDNEQPYTYNVTNVPAGSFQFTAIAFDNCSTQQTSTQVNVSVQSSASCADGIKNGSETGVDCGGSCPPCQTSGYCASKGNSTNYEFITRVIFSGIDNATQNTNGGYADHTNLIAVVSKGGSYPISLTTGRKSGSTAYNEGWNVYIDFNANGSFEDAGEMVLAAVSASTVNGQINIPVTAAGGNTRMRIQMQYKATVGHPCVSFGFGEVEDYTVLINGATTPCAGNQAPQVSLSSNASSYSTGASILLTANAADADGNVVKVEFFSNGVKLAEDVSSPFNYTMTNAQPGTYSFQARVTDNCNTTANASLNVTVSGGVDPCAGNTAPVITLTTDKTAYTTGQTIILNANATDNQGISRVEFYLGSTKLGEVVAQPYQYVHTASAGGLLSFTARAIDGCGASRDANANVTVNQTNTCNDGIKNGDETGVDCGGSCAPCAALKYCSAQGKTKYEYIGQVIFGSINHESGDNGGYGDFTSFSTVVTAGQVYNITLAPVYKKDTYNEGWSVWIDSNQDGDFDDSGEKVLSTLKNGRFTAAITIPANAKNGATRMRIIMQYKSLPSGPCTGPTWGEVEDYTLIIGGGQNITNELSAEPDVDVDIFPNPFQNSLTLNISYPNFGTVLVKMYNVLGQQVLQKVLTGNTLELNSLQPGYYFLEVRTADKKWIKKVLKH